MLVSVSASGLPADDHIWPFLVVCLQPSRGVLLHLFDAVEVIPPEPFRADSPFVLFNIAVLLRLAGLNVDQGGPCILSTRPEPTADVARAKTPSESG